MRDLYVLDPRVLVDVAVVISWPVGKQSSYVHQQLPIWGSIASTGEGITLLFAGVHSCFHLCITDL